MIPRPRNTEKAGKFLNHRPDEEKKFHKGFFSNGEAAYLHTTSGNLEKETK